MVVVVVTRGGRLLEVESRFFVSFFFFFFEAAVKARGVDSWLLPSERPRFSTSGGELFGPLFLVFAVNTVLIPSPPTLRLPTLRPRVKPGYSRPISTRSPPRAPILRLPFIDHPRPLVSTIYLRLILSTFLPSTKASSSFATTCSREQHRPR